MVNRQAGQFKLDYVEVPNASGERTRGLVDGTEVLTEAVNAQAQMEFQKRSQKALSSIVMAISAPQLYLVTLCKQPKKAWDTLCNHFKCETLVNKLFLKKHYFQYLS